MNTTSYYENATHEATERVVLAKDVKIDTYKDYNAKFYLPVLTPLLAKSKPYKRKKKAPSTKWQKSRRLKTKAYYESNYIVLTIPKSVVLLFETKIPKGTQFTASFIGGDQEVAKLKITSVYKYLKKNSHRADKQDQPRTPSSKTERIPWIRRDPKLSRRSGKHNKNRPQWSMDGKKWHDVIVKKSDRSTLAYGIAYRKYHNRYLTAENIEERFEDIDRRVTENRKDIDDHEIRIAKNREDIDELQRLVEQYSKTIKNMQNFIDQSNNKGDNK